MLLPSRKDRPQVILRPDTYPPIEEEKTGFVYAEIEFN